MSNILFRLLIVFSFVLFGFYQSRAQNAQEVFGKNKIQYTDDQFDWWIYETSNVVYYWYGKSRKVAEFYIAIAEAENKKIREIFEFHLKDKIELVIYSDISDLQQSNIDLDAYLTPSNWDEDPKVVDQKVLLYFDGNHQEALKLLRKGLIKIYFNSIFSGSQIEEAVQKVISLKLPDWFANGLVEYLSESWTEKDLYDMKSVLKSFSKRKGNFRRFSALETKLAGKSMWNYIVQNFGQQSISNWLYMTRIQKDVNQAAKLVFQRNLKNLYKDWYNYYLHELNRISLPSEKFQKLKLKKEEEVISVRYSKLFEGFALATNQNGKKRIRLLQQNKKRQKIIYSSGHRNKITIPTKNYPIYKENGKNYIILDQKRNRNYLLTFNKDRHLLDKNILPEDINEVYDMDYLNPKKIFLSATNNGWSDIFLYEPFTRKYTKVTDDVFDDIKLSFKRQDSLALYYLSARPEIKLESKENDTLLPIFPFNINTFSTLTKKSDFVEKTKVSGTINDFQLNENIYIFKSSIHNGDLFFALADSNKIDLSKAFLYKVGLGDQNKIVNIFRKPRSQYYVQFSTIKTNEFNNNLLQLKNFKDTILLKLQDSTETELSKLSKFVTDFEDPVNVVEIINDFFRKTTPFKLSDLKTSEFKYSLPGKKIKFNPSQSIAYRNRFSMDDWSTSFNNDILFGGLRTYSGISPVYRLPRPGILFKTKVQENFENYSLEFGIRVPTSFVGSEAFLLFNNFKKRWDHSFGIYRRSDKQNIPFRSTDEYQSVNKTFLVNYVAKYPLDHYRSFRLNTTIRNDHQFYKLSDQSILDSTDTNLQTLGLRLEYVYDDALQLSINLKEGIQIKAFFETNKRFETSLRDRIQLKGLPGFLFIAGVDARYFKPILKHSVFASRFFLNSSFGTQRLLNQLGGTENWLLLTKYSSESPSGQANNYSFSQLITEIRGHPIGARKGTSVMLFSNEVRVPFFQYLLHQNWRNSFLRNLQILAFMDVGISWDGFLPALADVEKFHYYTENPAVKINVIYSRNPFIAGTGLGLRTSLFGYFIRFDYGWPITELRLSNPIPHISLGLDF